MSNRITDATQLQNDRLTKQSLNFLNLMGGKSKRRFTVFRKNVDKLITSEENENTKTNV